MIAATYRFHGRGSLRRAYRQGQTVRLGHLSLKYLPNARRRKFRAAVVVSRKVNKSAVVRNRIRRRIYAALDTRKGEIAPYDLVLTVFSDQLATIDAQKLDRQLEDLLSRAGALSSQSPRRSKSML